MASSWLEFWGTDNPVYVSERQHDYYAAAIARDILALPEVQEGRTLLDYGSGDATEARTFADHGLQVLLYDPVPAVTERNRARVASDARIRVLDDASLDGCAGSVDVLVVVSVLQYVAPDDLAPLLARVQALLAPAGVLYIADVVPPHTSMLDDIRALFSAARKGGFVIAAALGLARTFFSDYRALRRSLGFATWDEAALLAALGAAGFAAERVYPNIGPTPHRMTVRAVKS